MEPDRRLLEAMKAVNCVRPFNWGILRTTQQRSTGCQMVVSQHALLVMKRCAWLRHVAASWLFQPTSAHGRVRSCLLLPADAHGPLLCKNAPQQEGAVLPWHYSLAGEHVAADVHRPGVAGQAANPSAERVARHIQVGQPRPAQRRQRACSSHEQGVWVSLPGAACWRGP